MTDTTMPEFDLAKRAVVGVGNGGGFIVGAGDGGTG
jgi:hypothetical protein